MANTFDDFLADLRAFESGWDRERYDAGIIQDWQLDSWAGGSVETYFPHYTSWSQLSDDEWTAMSYRSMNSYGFVGYQFGEALLIDLGYYDDDFYYGNGASTNTWDGTWTGKNGVDSLEEFMTADAQDVAIREAFGHNLKIIEDGLAAAGKSLDDYLGTARTYVQNGEQVTVTLTLTGILAGAHLRGAPATVSLLLNDTVSADEYGTSILQYIDQFGGYDSPTASELITYFEERLTGDEGLGTPGDGGAGSGSGSGGTSDNGTADVTAETADVVITWSWGKDTIVDDFDPGTGTIFIDWFSAADVSVAEAGGSVVFSIPGNDQTVTLQGVALADLSPANFTVRDAGLAGEIFALIGSEAPTGDGGSGDTEGDTGGDTSGGDTSGDDDTSDGEGDGSGDTDGGTSGGTASPNGTAGVTKATASVVVTWSWGANAVVEDFDPHHDTIFIDWFHAGEVDVSETDDGVVFAVPGNNQTITLAGIGLAELSAANFTIMDGALGTEILGLVGTDDGMGPGGTDGDTGTDAPVMHMISLTSPSTTVTDFDPTKDMIHIEQGITADRLEVVSANGDTTLTVTNSDGSILSTTVFVGIVLADLDIGNFSIAEQSALNEVATALGEAISQPGESGGKAVVYDSDGSAPPQTTGTADAGGIKYKADYNADDIVGFDPARDELDFGDTSVHNLILGKAPSGELIIDNPWWDEMQIVQGVDIADLTIENFGVVGNEHLRQDIGGVLSWELGIGPRDDDTVYIRSHEYGVSTVIDDFDPATMTISFLYYGTRERLSVEDTDDGLVISSYPSGQTFTFTDLKLSDLKPGNVAFHHDQVMEDNLEAAFGFSQDEVTLVSRSELLTPEAPAGQTTDGEQTRIGVGAPTGDGSVDDPPTDDGSGSGDGDTGDGGSDGGGDTGSGQGDGVADVFHLTWNWGAREVISGFAASEDVLDFGALSAGHVAVSEANGDLIFEVVGNGGHAYVLEDIQAEDLSAANFTAASWNTVLEDSGGVFAQLAALGNQDLLV